jgi:uroporphyrin-III C-methyltransferase
MRHPPDALPIAPGQGAAGRVYFVGAGPGADDLLTVRAIRVMARADVVLHDALLTDALLEWAPGARRIPVGKRCDGVSTGQSSIDRALVDAARRHPVVVRLKGGDPTVFGRLDEEIDALDAAGIDWEIVPGVTAASAAAAAAGHSLTRRGVARRLDIVTPRVGTAEAVADGPQDESPAWAEGLHPGGTVALYMAGRIAADCARVLLARGFGADVPAVAVRAASWPDQAVERSTLGVLAMAGLSVDARPVVLLVGRALTARDTATARMRLDVTPGPGSPGSLESPKAVAVCVSAAQGGPPAQVAVCEADKEYVSVPCARIILCPDSSRPLPI